MQVQQVVDKQLNRLFLVSLVRMSLIISLVEGLIMLFLPKIAAIIPIHENVLDTLLLILIGSPLLWLVVLKPVVKVIAKQQKNTTEQIRVNAELRMALDAHALVTICDTEGRIIYANEKFCELSGYSQEELLGQNHRIVNSGYHDKAYVSSIWETIIQGRIWQGEVCNRNKNGQLYWVDNTITPLVDETDTPYQYISILRDITSIKEAYAQLAIFKQAVQACSEMIVITDSEGYIQYANPAFYQITGWSEATLIGRRSTELDSPNADKLSLASMQANLKRQESWSGKLLNRRKGVNSLESQGQDAPQEPTEYWAELYITPILAANGELSGYVQIQRDVNEKVTREALEERVQEDTQIRLEVAKVLQQATPLKERCLSVLSLIFKIHSLQLQQKGGVFLRADGEEKLSLFVLQGYYGEEFNEKASSFVSVSRLCGRAAESGELLVSDDCYCDPRQQHKLINLHGHYIVPLAVSDNMLGVLFLYTDPYPVKNDSRLTMLKQVGEMLALAVMQERAKVVLEQARDLALQTAVAKSEFLANMSHEIRTPMNGVLGMLDILRDTEMSQGQTELVETAYASAEALLAILNDILDLSKLEAGKIEIENIDFNLATLIEDVCTLLAVPAFTKGLELNCYVPVELPHCWTGDTNRIRQVLTNLIGNAVKFTERGEVSVAVSAQFNPEGEALVRFEVRDTGIGISPETQERLFHVFTQADSSTSRRFGGTGLGLSISKILVELMGGTIGVDSELGKGACFWFSLPLASLEPREGNIVLPAQVDLKGKRVLVVDDNTNNRIILEHYVTSWGMTVSSVDNASAALVALMEATRSSKPVDILLSDLQMPFMDGLALARTICEVPTIAKTPRLLLTSGGIGSEAEYRALGFSQSLTKPVRQAQLFEAINNALRPVTPQSEKKRIDKANDSALNKEIWSDYSHKQVLVAEDNRVNQKVILAMLARFQVKPDLAENGQEALDRLAEKHYDLVLMDCEMPVMGGYEATSILRDWELANHRARTPVIALTAHASLEARETSLAAGMDGHLSKPVDRNALAATLAEWLASASNDEQTLSIAN